MENEKPLGNFGARIRVAYCLGFLSAEYFQALKTIKNIRNQFAHELHGLTFSDPEISKDCSKFHKLQIFEITKSGSPRQTFELATVFIWMHLGLHELQIADSRRKVPAAPMVAQVLSV